MQDDRIQGPQAPQDEPGAKAAPEAPGTHERTADGAPASPDKAPADAGEATADEAMLLAEAEAMLALENEVAALREETARLRDQHLRALAETENIRRRAERDKEDAARFAIGKFAGDLLDVAENLTRALAAVPREQVEQDDAVRQLFAGVDMIANQLQEAFRKHGLVRIDPQGEKFDPNFHQAMFQVKDSGAVPGTVAQVIQAGYVLNGRLLRPAMVGVAQGDPPSKVDTSA